MSRFEGVDLSEERLAQRRAAVGLDPAERNRLRDARARAEGCWEAHLESFYRRLQAHPETAPIVADPAVVERLIAAQRRYLASLFDPDLDLKHARGLVRMGLAHYRLRVTPQWYIASCAHLLCDHVDALMAGPGAGDRGLRDVVALIRALFYDLGFVLDAYGAGETNTLQQHARQVIAPPDRATERPEVPRAAEPAATPRPAVSRIRLSSDDVAERRAYLDIGADELGALRALAPFIATHIPAVLDDFYEYLASEPETTKLVPPNIAARLKQQVASYWRELVASDFERTYAASRLRIGMMHERIGLSLQWYFGGLARQLVAFLCPPAADEALPPPALDAVSVKALIRAVCFDLSFVIDAYMEARADALLRTDSVAHDLIAGLSAAVAVVSEERRVVSANPALLEMLPGASAALLYRMPVSLALPLPEVDAVLARVAAGSETRAVASGRLGGRRLRITAMRLASRPDMPDGGFALVFDDVSEILRLASEFAEGESDLSRLVDCVDAVVWEMEPASYTIVAISAPALALTGYRDMFYLGRAGAWIDSIAAADRERVQRRLAALQPDAPLVVEYRFDHAGGEERWFRSHVTLAAAGDRVQRWRAVTVDVTARSEAERRRLEAIGLLGGSVGHVLNNSLMAISGGLHLQTKRLGGLRKAPLLAQALEEVERAAAVTDRLVGFAGRHALRPARVEPDAILHELVRELQAEQRAGVTVECLVATPPWPIVADRDRLLEVLRQLVANACEAADGDVRLLLHVSNVPSTQVAEDESGAGSDWVEFAVADSGPGMTPEVRVRALDPFFSTKAEQDGHYGLGLSMVHGFATQSGGYVVLESEVGIGTVVRLRLPRSVQPAAQGAVAAGRPPRILVVEDHDLVRRVVASLVDSLGYAATAVANASEAIEVLTADPCDVLLTDVRLGPGSDGVELARAAEFAYPGIGVILMSGFAAEALNRTALPDHWEFLEKPFEPKDLERALDAVLAAHRRRAALRGD